MCNHLHFRHCSAGKMPVFAVGNEELRFLVLWCGNCSSIPRSFELGCTMRKLLKISLLLTILVFLGAGIAKADSLTYQGVTFNVSVSGNTVTMVVSGSGCTFVA